MKCIKWSTTWSMMSIISAIMAEAIITRRADFTTCFWVGQEVL